MEKSYKGACVAILGGGQLGRMLIQEAVNLNLDTRVLDPDAEAPCKHIATEFIHGSLQEEADIRKVAEGADVVTIEFEHINVDALQKLEDEGKKVYPQPSLIRIVQDKGVQKEFYASHNIPTADFRLVSNKEEALATGFFPCFQKLRKSGYDGKGVVRLDSAADKDKAFEGPSVLENLVDFQKEISVIVSRNASGQINCFPPVELEFNPEANLVEFLFSPADISAPVAVEATRLAIDIAEKLNLIGILAVEMFLTKDGQVLVNEIAPRPHNSGHQTIEGNLCSQYEQHLRAILNLPPGDTHIKMPSVMVNLLGEKGHTGPAVYSGMNEVLSIPGVSVHLYGKKNTKPFRKMGHVTIVDQSLEEAKKKAKKVKEFLRVITE